MWSVARWHLFDDIHENRKYQPLSTFKQLEKEAQLNKYIGNKCQLSGIKIENDANYDYCSTLI